MTTTTTANPLEEAVRLRKAAGKPVVIKSANMKAAYAPFLRAGERAAALERHATRPGSGIKVLRIVR